MRPRAELSDIGKEQTVDVSEQNPEALAFHLANGFIIVGRSALDGGGRPFPLLHLRETIDAASAD